MHYNSNPLSIQLELSNVCNALCTGCNRNEVDYDAVKELKNNNIEINISNLPIKNRKNIGKPTHLDTSIIDNILTSNVFKSLTEIHFCGTIDDPFAYAHMISALQKIRNYRPEIFIGIQTNGSIRTPDFYKSVGKLLAGTNHKVWFSIDGLEDTNHYYRKNCQWPKIMENAQAFIDVGGKAGWQFLIFPWNKHQVNEAKSIASFMGFKNFRTRVNKEKLLEDINSHLEKKSNSNLIPDIKPDSEIQCAWKNELRQYHVSYDGKLWPCCYFNSFKHSRDLKLSNRLSLYGNKNWNSLYHHDADTILNNKFYTTDLVESWLSQTHGNNSTDRIHICTKTCSKNIAYPGRNEISLTRF